MDAKKKYFLNYNCSNSLNTKKVYYLKRKEKQDNLCNKKILI